MKREAMLEESLAKAKDLSIEEPRSMAALLDGYPWLPRMIDKARAARAGSLGAHYRYPCPIDVACLRLLRLSSDAFADLAVASTTDDAVLRSLRSRCAQLPDLVAFDPLALNERLHRGGS